MMGNKSYTNELKAIKFDELMAEYSRLVLYRHNLAGTILSNVESMIKESTTLDTTTIMQIDKKINPESLRSIHAEIKRVDNVISFINSVIYGDENIILDSQLDNTNTNEDELTGTD